MDDFLINVFRIINKYVALNRFMFSSDHRPARASINLAFGFKSNKGQSKIGVRRKVIIPVYKWGEVNEAPQVKLVEAAKEAFANLS